MIRLRKLHLLVGFVLLPLVFVQALTGLLQRLRLSDTLTFTIHTWFKYRFDFARSLRLLGTAVGVVLGLALMFLAVSGGIVYLNTRIQQSRRARARKAQTPPPAA